MVEYYTFDMASNNPDVAYLKKFYHEWSDYTVSELEKQMRLMIKDIQLKNGVDYITAVALFIKRAPLDFEVQCKRECENCIFFKDYCIFTC
ncbi:MAG: hypothetical protein IJH63_10265 [Methanobrevibacter sp.]|nr:hypothetical protein [Methanosphaera sp.]MBR0371083.1 hypothetical protein [Methanobrevibacter sp.]